MQLNFTPPTAGQPQAQQQPGLGSKILSGVENVGKGALDALSTAGVRFGQVAGNAIAPALGIPQANIDYANKQPTKLPLTGTTLPAQKAFGQGGGEQIGGQALTAGAYLAPEFMGGGVASGGIIKGALQGAGIGAVSGGLGGAGSAMSQGANASDVLNSGVSGAKTGAIAGGITGSAAGLAGNVWNKAYGQSSYDTNLQNTTAAKNQVGATATDSIHEASNTLSDMQVGAGNQYDQAPKIISKVDPTAKVTYPADFVDKVNQLKETKAYSLPDFIKNPVVSSDIKNIGSGERIASPQQAQEFIKGLNDLKFNSKGDVVVNQQVSNLVDEAKRYAQNDLGHVTDNMGNSVWSKMSQDYQTVQDTREALSSLIPIKKFPGEMLDPTEVNNSVNKMMKMMETPQGISALQRANAETIQKTGYDVLGDPMGTIQKLADSNADFAKALKGNYGHQFVQGLKNPTLASRRVVFAATTILGITGMATAFRKQVGSFISGQ